jgi:plastocyanin
MKAIKQFRPELSSILLGLFLVSLAALFFTAGPSSRGTALLGASKITPASNFDFEVSYTVNGFVPNFLEIPLGSRVAFRNTTNIPLSVASDPHPTHGDYPLFDAKAGFVSGQAYIFTFGKTGTYGYHNHERSIDRGIIRVVDPAHPVPNVDKTVQGQRAVRDELLDMFTPKDPNSIFKVVDAIQSDAVLSRNCHDISHDLGHRAYELYGFSEAMTFNNPHHVKHALVQYICAGGYMHGILEELSLHDPDFKTKPDVICDMVSEEDRASCYHGTGHVFMLADQRDASSSISDCRRIEQTSDMYRCFEGVRMEQFWGNTAHVGTSTLGWDLEKPLAPCLDIKEDEKPTCFLYSSFGYLRTHVKDYSGAVEMCTQSGLKASDAEFCLKGLGITMMSKFKGQHLERSEIYVEWLPDREKHAFYQGVLGYARLSGVGEKELKNTCALFKNDGDICLAALLESK